MLEVHLAEASLVEVPHCAQRITDQRPAELQFFVLAGRKRVTGEPDSGMVQGRGRKEAKIIRDQPPGPRMHSGLSEG